MPELPEVSGLVTWLGERLAGRVVVEVQVASIAVLKTYAIAPEALIGRPVDGVARHGKWIDIDVDGTHLCIHLARGGWLRWSDALPETRLRPGGKSTVALRVRLDDGSGFDLTEAGTKKGLAVHLVDDPAQVPGIASLGPEPLSPELNRKAFGALLAGRRMQIKGLLRDQSVIAGVGNAYSDEILHAARISPFAMASSLDEAEVDILYEAMATTLEGAVAAAAGRPASELKDAKRQGMRVHGRTGEACPVCGDTVREVSFADRSLQYCATCQTGGKPLADRRTSRFLK